VILVFLVATSIPALVVLIRERMKRRAKRKEEARAGLPAGGE
jgi:hypothetical protein